MSVHFSLHDSIDHLVKLGFEIGFDLVDFGELGKGPAPEPAEIVHTGNPVGSHGRLLFLGVFAPIAFDLNNQMQRVVLPVVY